MRVFRPVAAFTSVLALTLSLISGLVLAAPAQAAGEAMVVKISTTYANQQVTLPLFGTVSATVDWGDSTTSSPTSAGQLNHTFAATGTHTVSITGTVTQFGWGSNCYNNAHLITEVVSFGDIGLTSLSGAFGCATGLTTVPTTLPSTVTDLSYVFYRAFAFNQDISAWNTANVTNLEGAFFFALNFNQDISAWNTANVTNMSQTFRYTEQFNKPLNAWNTSKVTNMAYMFRESFKFNQDLNSWDVSKVTSFHEIFYVALAFNGNISSWNTSSATSMRSMFSTAWAFNQDISAWDTSKVTDFVGMFAATRVFNQDIGSWNTSAATNMNSMFSNSWVFNQDISAWNTSNVLDMSGMFQDAGQFNQEIGIWDVSKVVAFASTFAGAGKFNGDIGAWNTGAATNMSCMFCSAIVFNQDIGLWNTGNVTTMNSMFSSAWAFDQDITAWDVSSVENMSSMFSYTRTFNQDISIWDTSSVVYMDAMFQGARAFNVALPQTSTPGDWNTSNVVYMQGMFNESWVFNQDVRSWDTSKVQYMQWMFANSSVFNTALNTTVGGWNTSSVVDMSYMFSNNSVFDQDISSWNTGSVVNMNGTFQNAIKFNQNISTWDVSKVVYMSNTFENADAFDQPIGVWDTSSVVQMNYTFANTALFNHSINAWNTTNVNQMIGTFQGAVLFNQPLSSWDVSNVLYMQHMFRSTQAFNQPLNAWNVSKVQSFESTFHDTEVFDQPLDNWNTSSATVMYNMFYGAKVFNQNIESWDVSHVNLFAGMFAYTPLFNQPLQNWDTSAATQMQDMFHGAQKFNLPIDTWNTSNVIFMSWMFAGAPEFNQPIMTWDVSKVYYFDHMFYGATKFDMDLSAWETPASQSFTNFFAASGIANAHYSAFLSSRANHTPAYNNYNRIDASAQFLCPAETDRTKLQNDMFWQVYDEGKASCLTSQSVNFTQPEDFGLNKTRILEATATSELPVTFLWISGPCVVNGNKLTATAEGVCVIAAQQKGNASFDDAIDALRTVTVLPEVPPTVTYNANGGDLGTVPVDANSPYDFNAEITVLGPGTLGFTGEEFLGWTLNEDGTGTVYQAGDTIQLTNQDIILYAKWTTPPPTHVTYVGTDSDSGDVPVDATDYAKNDTVTVLDGGTLYRHGFEFAGWNTQSDGGGITYVADDTFSMGLLDVSLYAVWTALPAYHIVYNANGALTGPAPTDSTNYFAGDTITVADKGSLAWVGYSFVGWNTADDGSGTPYAVGDEITVVDADFELFAQWTDAPTYTVTYFGNSNDGGSVPTDSNNYLDGDTFSAAGVGDLTRDGYTFLGWNTEEDGSGVGYESGDVVSIDGANVNLHAQWSLDPTYTITYFGNGATGGSVNVDTTQYASGDVVMVVDAGDLVRAGYTFIGWNSKADGSGINFPVLVTTQFADANLELHAQWQKNKVAASKKLKVLFKTNSWSLSRANKEKIKAFVKRYTLKSRANIVITILGFVEPTKATANDIALSKKRAHAVTYFLKTIGVKAKFKAIAKGKMSYTLSGARRATIVVDWSSQLK